MSNTARLVLETVDACKAIGWDGLAKELLGATASYRQHDILIRIRLAADMTRDAARARMKAEPCDGLLSLANLADHLLNTASAALDAVDADLTKLHKAIAKPAPPEVAARAKRSA